MNIRDLIIDILIGIAVAFAIGIVPALIYNAAEKRKFRRECEEMFNFYDRMRELVNSGNEESAMKCIDLRNKINAEKRKINDTE